MRGVPDAQRDGVGPQVGARPRGIGRKGRARPQAKPVSKSLIVAA